MSPGPFDPTSLTIAMLRDAPDFVPHEQELLREHAPDLLDARPMSERIRPIGDRVVVRQDSAKAMSASGRLHLPDSAKQLDCTGTVLAIGPRVENVQKGDRVIFKRRAMSSLMPDEWADGTTRDPEANVLILRDEDMVAVIEPGTVVEVAAVKGPSRGR